MEAVLLQKGLYVWSTMQSQKKYNSLRSGSEIKKNMKNIEECLKENLTETDVEILNSSITDIAEKTEEKQKTLKEHHKDIVTCAEMFFLEYGEYFTEKEKKLVVEACRIHDLGKVNLVFQAMICPKLAENFI